MNAFRRTALPFLVLGLLLVGVLGSAFAPLGTGIVMAESVIPTVVASNSDCEDRGYDNEFKLEGGSLSSGTKTIPSTGGRTLAIILYSEGNEKKSFDWTSTLGMDAVIVKAATTSNVYTYNPPVLSYGDTNLVGPENKGISHISFCYNSVPTADYLGTVNGVRRTAAVKVKWQTVSELNVVGFNVWRSNRKNGTYAPLNDSLIPPANPGTLNGARYKYTDTSIESGKTYWYKVEVVGTGGMLETSDPVRVPKPPTP